MLVDIADKFEEVRDLMRAIDADIAERAVAGEKIDAWSIRRWDELHSKYDELSHLLDEQIKSDEETSEAYSVPINPADATQCESCQ